VEFRVLGPLEVLQGDRLVRVGGARQRSLLALLLIRANELVSSDQLIDELWRERPPSEAANALQAAVSRLRRALAAGNATERQTARLVTRSPGYLFAIDPEFVDARQFERLVRDGREALARGDPLRAATLLGAGMALWRGQPLADFVYEPFAQAEIARLEELRLVATEDRMEADLNLGRALDVAPELESLVTRHPFRERLRGQLMLALYKTGRQAEALEAYRQGQRTMAAELGIDPSPALRELEAAILRQDPSLSPLPSVHSLAVRSRVPLPATTPDPVPGAKARKTATVVFAGLAARTTSANRHDSGPVQELARRYRAIATDCFGRHGGWVEGGDDARVVAVFGLPFLHEDDGLRALRAAWELNARASGLRAEPTGGVQIEVLVRIGVSTGEVVAADTARSAAATVGEPVRIAARLMEIAAPGETLIDDITYRIAAAAVEAEPYPVVVSQRELAVGSVRRVTEVVPLTAARRRHRSAMVGREMELAQLRQAFEWAGRRRTAYLTTVLGAAGIGKTRLALEFGGGLREEATVLTGRCLSYGEGITYWPLREILLEAFGHDLGHGIEKLLAGDADAPVIGRQLAGATGSADENVAVEEIRWAARRVFEALARRRPLLLVIDDLQWAEPTFLDLVEYLLERSSEAPLMVLCLARPDLLDTRPGWAGGRPNSASVLLDALPDDDARLLLRLLADEVRLEAAADQRVLAAADGNPLFLEQIVAALAVDRRGDGFLALPATVQALLAARLERLGPGERAVLERAAVIGKDFDRRSVAALLPEEAWEPLARHLEHLARKRFIRETAALPMGDASYRFDHVLVQEAVYRGISTPVRADLHERLADCLEPASADGRIDAAELLGYHLEQAYRSRAELGAGKAAVDLAGRAASALISAGGAARARGDMPATANLLGRAAALLPPNQAERREILPDLAKALMEKGDLEAAENLLEEAMRIAERTGDRRLAGRATVALELQHARSFPKRTRQADSHKIVERVIPTLEQANDAAGLADAWLYLASSDLWLGRSIQAQAEAQRAAEYARQAGDRWREVAAIDQVAYTCMSVGPVTEAVRELAALRRRAGVDKQGRARIDLSLALALAFQGRLTEARELAGSATTALEDMGMTLQALYSVMDRAQVELVAGDAHAAEEHLRPALARLLTIGEHAVASTVAALLAEALSQQGKDGAAERAATQAMDLSPGDDRFTRILARTALARVHAHRGELAAAEALAREAVEDSLQTDWADQQADALTALAEVLRIAGREQAVSETLGLALERYEQRENVVAARRVRGMLATT
jgi:predicted ATPase/DNA-binding SARP family transcriptional activator/class 3 adenylate cyclase